MTRRHPHMAVRIAGANSEHAPPPQSSRPHWLRGAFLVAVAAFAAVFAFVDLGRLWVTLRAADPHWLLAAIMCGGAAYFFMSLSYQRIAAAAGAVISLPAMLRITLVANTVNYLLSTGGLSGFAARMYFFTQRRISLGTALLISFVQTFLTNLTLLFFLFGGFFYLFHHHRLRGSVFVVTSLLLVILTAGALVATLLLFHPRLRRLTLFWLGQTAYWVMYRILPHRTPPRTRIWRYQRRLQRGIEFLLSRKHQMIEPGIYICLDWVFTLLILQSAFHAVNYPARLSVTIVGFAIGIVLSFVSFIPSGLGVMEGSMAAVYTSVGIPFETALLAALIFRFVYYVLPILLSLFVFHGSFVQGRRVTKELRGQDLFPLE